VAAIALASETKRRMPTAHASINRGGSIFLMLGFNAADEITGWDLPEIWSKFGSFKKESSVSTMETASETALSLDDISANDSKGLRDLLDDLSSQRTLRKPFDYFADRDESAVLKFAFQATISSMNKAVEFLKHLKGLGVLPSVEEVQAMSEWDLNEPVLSNLALAFDRFDVDRRSTGPPETTPYLVFPPDTVHADILLTRQVSRMLHKEPELLYGLDKWITHLMHGYLLLPFRLVESWDEATLKGSVRELRDRIREHLSLFIVESTYELERDASI